MCVCVCVCVWYMQAFSRMPNLLHTTYLYILNTDVLAQSFEETHLCEFNIILSVVCDCNLLHIPKIAHRLYKTTENLHT